MVRLALAVILLAACAAPRETQRSRDFLNCVYTEHHDNGLTRVQAEEKCRQ